MPPADSRVPTLRSTQIVLLSLVLGLLAFSVVAVVLRPAIPRASDPEIPQVLLMLTAGVAFAEIAAFVFLRNQLLARVGASRAEALDLLRHERIPPALHTLAVIGGALAEGVGLLGLIAFFLGGPWYALAAPALAIVAILLQVPTRERLDELVRALAT